MLKWSARVLLDCSPAQPAAQRDPVPARTGTSGRPPGHGAARPGAAGARGRPADRTVPLRSGAGTRDAAPPTGARRVRQRRWPRSKRSGLDPQWRSIINCLPWWWRVKRRSSRAVRHGRDGPGRSESSRSSPRQVRPPLLARLAFYTNWPIPCPAPLRSMLLRVSQSRTRIHLSARHRLARSLSGARSERGKRRLG